MKEKQRLRILLEKLNFGQCSEEELVELSDMFKDRRHHVGNILEEDWRSVINETVGGKSEYHEDTWRRIEAEITSQRRQHRKTVVVKLLTRAAASAAILLVTWLTLSYFIGKTSPEYVHVTNSSVKPLTVNLPDGSRVVLDKNSEIRYPKVFASDHRDVYLLQGKALYDVARAPERPFTVYTHHLSTTALGTSFVIDARSGKDSLNISLLTGRVVVKPVTGREDKEWFLGPGEALTSHIAEYNVRLHTFEREGALEWTRDLFEFNNRPLEEVLALLEHDYNIDFQYSEDVIENCRITGKFSRFGDLEDILRLIFFPIDLKCKTADSTTFEIYGQGCR